MTYLENACITNIKKMRNLLNVRDVWSWLECSGLKLDKCAKLECTGV